MHVHGLLFLGNLVGLEIGGIEPGKRGRVDAGGVLRGEQPHVIPVGQRLRALQPRQAHVFKVNQEMPLLRLHSLYREYFSTLYSTPSVSTVMRLMRCSCTGRSWKPVGVLAI